MFSDTGMIVSVTRLRLRSLRYLLPFAYHSRRAHRQAEQSPGCLGAQVRKTGGLAFWTLTFWDNETSLRNYLSHGPHRQVMPKLSRWCDEAAVTHWTHDGPQYPAWEHAAVRLAEQGRLLRVAHPSELHKSGRIGLT